MEIKRPNVLLYANIISFDIETKDPELKLKGPGVYRKDGYILGVSLTNGEFSEYYNLGHFDCTKEERQKNLRYIDNVMRSPSTKLGTNIKYDMDWLINYQGIHINGDLIDIQIAEPLINENQMKFNLDFLAIKYLGRGKFKTEIDQFCKENDLKGDSRKWLWKMPYDLVRQYAIEDVKEPFEIWKLQEKILQDQDLMDLFKLEMGLFPLLLMMRKNGVRINLKRLEKTKTIFEERLEKALKSFKNVSGKFLNINHNSSREIGFLLDKLGIEYPLTEKTQAPSIQKQWLLNNVDRHPVFQLIHDCRKYEHMINTFLVNNIGNMVVKDRLHCSFNSMKSDEYGTVSGRFSSSKPNLQQIPANDLEVGKDVRALFIPEDGCEWVRLDYSQVEIRFVANYAIGKGADTLRQQFIDDPTGVDYHQWCADLTGVTRKFAKKINFGILYGMGVKKLGYQLNMTYDEARNFMKMYYAKLPFIKKTLDIAKTRAADRGYVHTLLKRRRRFPGAQFTYKAFNAVVQGSAADVMKKGMYDSYKAGIYNTLIPHLTVHDESDTSKPRTKEGKEAVIELKHIMENCVKIKIPLIVDVEVGKNWGELEEWQ
jgi:DNA polymerase-1